MRTTVMVAPLLAGAFGACLFGMPQNQVPRPSIEQQLRKQYALTRVGTNGVVTQAGSVLVVQQDGLKAIPALYQGYFGNNVKKGGPIKANYVQHQHIGAATRRRGSSRLARRHI